MKKQILIFLSLIGYCEASDFLPDVKRVNNYFNSFQYVSDMKLHNEKDKWMSPTEFKEMKAGDCEDFAIAKFFELKKLGIPEEQLLLVYSLYKKEAHMILVYYDNNKQPYILDNINKELKKPDELPYLRVVYGFNTHSIYPLNSLYNIDYDIGKTNNIKRFNDIVEKELKI